MLNPNFNTMPYFTPPLPTYLDPVTSKFPPEYCYYRSGSFILLKQVEEDRWLRETTTYGIYYAHKNLEIFESLSGLQNILRAELMALYDSIKININQYQNEPMHIFIDSLNSIYLFNTQIKHPSLHNNHPNKTILFEMIQMLQ